MRNRKFHPATLGKNYFFATMQEYTDWLKTPEGIEWKKKWPHDPTPPSRAEDSARRIDR